MNTSQRRRLGIGMIIGAIVVTVLAVVFQDRLGVVALFLLAIATFNALRGALWLAHPPKQR
jgi:hypothetical protein